MPNQVDLTGQIFGFLKVIRLIRSGVYECHCNCGNKLEVSYSYLNSGHTKSCGCLRKRGYFEDLVGKKFGRLEVLSFAGKKNTQTLWNCLCDCGNETLVRGKDLKYKSTMSCGCLKLEYSNANSPLGRGFEKTTITYLKSNKLSKANTSGTTGVYFNKRRGQWVSEIMFKGKKYVRYFNNEKFAIDCRKEMKNHYHGEFIEWWEENYGK